MKGSGKVLSVIGFITCMMLFYVHLQIASVIVSFELNRTSKTYAMKQELLRRLEFNVNQLKAPRLLEEKMKKNELTLGLPGKIQVVEVPPMPNLHLPVRQGEKHDSGYSSAFTKFFGRLIQTAQAKTDTSV